MTATSLAPVRLTPPVGRTCTDTADTIFVKGGPWARMICGLASSGRAFDGTILSPGGCQLSLPLPLHYEHGEAIGQVTLVRRSATGIFIRARLYKSADDAWSAIYYGRAAGLSVSAGGLVTEQRDGVQVFREWRIKEVSVCRQPRNSDCILRIYNGGRYG